MAIAEIGTVLGLGAKYGPIFLNLITTGIRGLQAIQNNDEEAVLAELDQVRTRYDTETRELLDAVAARRNA